MTDKTSLAAGTFAGARARIQDNASRGLWSSRWVFFLAATGSAVGLGNIWKFPYITGEYGGGAFVLMYLACILAIGIPVMMTEIAIGRRGRGSPIDAIGRVVRENNGNPLWKAVGGMAMLAGFMILCFYVVVAGWAFAYTWKMLDGSLAATSVEALGGVFEAHNANPWQLGGWSVLVALLTLWIVAKGVQKGIENAVRWMMPGLAVLLLIHDRDVTVSDAATGEVIACHHIDPARDYQAPLR